MLNPRGPRPPWAQMTLLDISKRTTLARMELDSEPAFCGLGPNHAAVGMNNQVRLGAG
jgi:WD repeat-containing protein 19